MNKTIVIIIVLVLIAVGAWFFFQGPTDGTDVSEEDTEEEVTDREGEEMTEEDETETVIGRSVEGREITAYHYGSGDTELLFVGGMHGGYSWNTALVAFELMDWLEEDSSVVPEGVKVTVVPVLNPDGLNEVVGTAGRFDAADVPSSEEQTVPGRFNARGVDLNRNFDCDWQPEGVWQSRTVDAGEEVFSEPESQALRDYVLENNPDAVIVWYSAVGGVFASNCHSGVLDETLAIMNVYAEAASYPAYESYDFYEITGDAVNWMAKNDIPAISVLLTTHQSVEWDKNRAGVEALFEHYSN